MEKSFFQNQVSRTNLYQTPPTHHFDPSVQSASVPKKAIAFYSGVSVEPEELLCGTLGRMTDEKDTDRLAMYLLSMFTDDQLITESTLTDYFAHGTISKKRENILNVIKDALSLLIDNGMIRYGSLEDDSDFLVDKTENGYYLTSRGRNMRGYAIRMKSFNRMCDIADNVFAEDELYKFDFFMTAMEFEDFSNGIQNLLSADELTSSCNRTKKILLTIITFYSILDKPVSLMIFLCQQSIHFNHLP